MPDGKTHPAADHTETVRVKTTIGPDGRIHLDVASRLPPGPAEVVIGITPIGATGEMHWAEHYGLGAHIWNDEDAQAYVDRLRDEWAR